MAGQNMSGLSLTRPNTAGSLPSGSSVAETKETRNTVDSPYCGNASDVQQGLEPGFHRCASIIDSAHGRRAGARAGGYTRASFFSTAVPSLRPAHAHRPDRAARQPVRRPDGRGHRPAVPHAVPQPRRRLRGERDGDQQARAVAHAEDVAPRRPQRRAGARSRCRSPASTRPRWPTPRATTSTAARRSSTSTWAARPRRCATSGPARR